MIDSVVIFCLSVCLSVTLVDIVNLLSGLFCYLVSSSILVVKMLVKFFWFCTFLSVSVYCVSETKQEKDVVTVQPYVMY